MNAEALIGTVLGTCTLQRLIGQGGMGAVYLAQQSRPRRRVAVKVLLPMAPLTPQQLAAFVERFRRETDAAASLEHPNITPVYEYGEHNGLTYLVMPYISAGTLRDEMEREGPLPLDAVANYLEQMAAALDFAHQRGVIHRDIKPANMLMTPEGRVLLTDFGLVKIISDGQMPQIRLTGAGAPVGTPDYMAPEQVIGEEVDARADLYSLGVILYQMVTGTTPFQGETPMQIAAQHLQAPPPAPHMFRRDLPITGEQVMMRALAKRPADRYQSAQELTDAFCTALMNAGVELNLGLSQSSGRLKAANPANTGMTGQFLRQQKSFDPTVQTGTVPTIGAGGGSLNGATGAFRPVGSAGAKGAMGQPMANIGGLPNYTGSTASVPQTPAGGLLSGATGAFKPAGGGLLSGATGAFKPMGGGLLNGTTGNTPAAHSNDIWNGGTGVQPTANGLNDATGTSPAVNNGGGLLSRAGLLSGATSSQAAIPTPGATGAFKPAGGGLLSRTGKFPGVGNGTGMMPSLPMASVATPPEAPAMPGGKGLLATYGGSGQTDQLSPALEKTTTASLSAFNQVAPNTVQTNSLKIVKVPVAGQPGQYVTGFLPVAPQPLELPEAARRKKGPALWMKIVAIVVAVMLLGGGAAGAFWYINSHQSPTVQTPNNTNQQAGGAPNKQATGTTQTQTSDPNVILNDTLSQNTHGWPTSPQDIYSFKDGAYHITEKNDQGRVTVLQTDPFTMPLVYSLTMQEVKGDDGSINNSFGMLFNFSQKTQGDKTITTFYSFEIQNTKGGEYQFWKYDDTKGKNAASWTMLWHQPFTGEFHYGKGNNASNTIKIAVTTDHKFTFTVNGKAVKTVQDNSFISGMIGMIVNLDGTEVAFNNLLLTRK